MFSFIEPILIKKAFDKLIFAPNRWVFCFVGSICLIIGLALTCSDKILFIGKFLGIALILFSIYHFVEGFYQRIIVDQNKKLVSKRSILAVKDIAFSDIKEIVLDKQFGFIIYLFFQQGKSMPIAIYRNISNAEAKAYATADLLSKIINVRFKDRTLPSLIIGGKIKDKIKILDENALFIRVSFTEIPKDWLIFGSLFLFFAIFCILILPPTAPWPVKVIFPLFSFMLAMATFIYGYRWYIFPQLIEKSGDHIVIKRLFLGKELFKKKLLKAEIRHIVPRMYVYRQERYASFKKGFCVHIITKEKSYEIGAQLSSDDIKKIKSFIGEK